MKNNKYLKELGINDDYFLFENPDDFFAPNKLYSLDVTLSMIIYSYLCEFRDNYLECGHPASMTQEEWNEKIDIMIKGFRLYIENQNVWDISKNKAKQIKYGMRTFVNYFSGLWW